MPVTAKVRVRLACKVLLHMTILLSFAMLRECADNGMRSFSSVLTSSCEYLCNSESTYRVPKLDRRTRNMDTGPAIVISRTLWIGTFARIPRGEMQIRKQI